jgi:hypothetical protein
MLKKLVPFLIVVLLGGGVFAAVKRRGKTVDVPEDVAASAKVTPKTTVDMRGPHDPKKVDQVEMAPPPDVPTM